MLLLDLKNGLELLLSALLLWGQEPGAGAALLMLRFIGRKCEENRQYMKNWQKKRVALTGCFSQRALSFCWL